MRRTADVWQQEDIVEFAIAGMDAIRFAVVDIETGGADSSAAQRGDQRIIIDDAAARC